MERLAAERNGHAVHWGAHHIPRPPDRPTVPHGTRYAYDRGCHCPECKAASLAARRASRAKSGR